MEQRLGEELKIAGQKAQYDEHAKSLLALKEVLAQILVGVTEEFKGMTPEEAIPYIEGNAEVGVVSVLTGETNTFSMIKGTNLESKIPGEGQVNFDVRFYVRDPRKKERIEIIIDVEAQKENPLYDLVSRGIFYNARQISAQLDRDFKIPNYNDIKKVYSIWICMNSPKKLENSIIMYAIQPKTLVGNAVEYGNYDLMSVVLINLSQKIAEQGEGRELLRYLGTLFSAELKPEEKISRIEKEYGTVNNSLKKEVMGMCNLSDLIWENGIEKGRQSGIEENRKEVALKMLRAGKPDEEILEFLSMTVMQLDKLKKELNE